MTPNRLSRETSLYLRQHANNPVDWYPWGDEALARARAEQRPVFLSIGYSACHWCHVMEHESFEDPATAEYMNAHFVCIKVDREERPDLDTIYMTALQLMTREGGGWPLSVFLTPDLTPFYAGTYFPPDDRYAAHGRPSFRQVLAGVADAWENRREQVLEIGRNTAQHLGGIGRLEPGEGELGPDLLRDALSGLRRSFDPTHGGFGSAPKFPHAVELRLLLRLHRRFQDSTALDMVRTTLDKMARGGIYDQIGGGFHRYSVDAKWLVPHFEKMLYDNALLTTAYVEAFQVTGDPFYKQIASETLDYILFEMTSPDGAFYSTQDADSEGEEGKFYVWSEREIVEALGPDLAPLALRTWDVSERGNFEGHNILVRAKTDEQDARLNRLEVGPFRDKLLEVRRRLLEVRSKRVAPGRDEKILTAWNGLMIAAFARAGSVFDEPRYRQAAKRAADFVLTKMRTAEGRLFRTTGEGQTPKLSGYLEDYAYLIDALITIPIETGEIRWLRAAVELAETMIAHFADPAGPGFYFTADDHEQLITRTKDIQDGSTPSGNAVAVTALLKLAKLCDRQDFSAKAEETLRAYRQTMADHPSAAGQMLLALDFAVGPAQEVVVVGRADEETDRVRTALRTTFEPNRVVVFHDPTTTEIPPELATLLRDRPMIDGQVTTYICENYTCREPVVGAAAALTALGSDL